VASRKPDRLSVRYSKRQRDHVIDFPSKPDGHLLHGVLFAKRMRPDLATGGFTFEPSLADELAARGYDVTTLRFQVDQKKAEPDGSDAPDPACRLSPGTPATTSVQPIPAEPAKVQHLPSIEQLVDLDTHALAYRFLRAPGEGRKRAPSIEALAAFINQHFAGHLVARVEPWGETPYRKIAGSRLIRYTGKRREGRRLTVHRAREGRGCIDAPDMLDHRTTETYRTNYDVVRQIVEWHRKLQAEGKL
jgi:hypothetical protein